MGNFEELIAALPERIVETEYGPVRGYILSGVANFKGIPYAAPPIGGLRWRLPEPPARWKQPLDATKFGFVCPQDGSRFPVFGKMGEDCLNLNVWAPEKWDKGLCPVMVFLHGGGFSTGSGSLPPYDGTYFAAHGTILVTINYRLNVLGFLALPELTAESATHTSGNYGIIDQVFALRWIKANIKNFGGDPDNVTIFGESAGGASVAALMSSAPAANLFHKAIVQSGGNAPPLLRKLGEFNGHLECAEARGAKFAGKIGLDGGRGSLEKLRTAPAIELAAAWYKHVHEEVEGVGMTGAWMINQLIIDNYVLHDAPAEIFRRGKQHNVPFITGINADEGTLFQFLLLGDKRDADRYKGYISRVYGNSGDKVIEYFGGHSQETVDRAACNTEGIGFFCGSRKLARSMSEIQTNTYKYLFSMPPKFFIYQLPGIADWQERFGCYHAAEIPYVFHFMLLPGLLDPDRALSEKMAGYWMQFARTGDPNRDGSTVWPRYTRKEEAYLIFDNPIDVGRGFKDEPCNFIEELERSMA
jgi:para-nitrobenzyl esterase